ncbi:hypothetical protein C8J56DRAFT_1048063 [Mycena floridula]|nr:hypothetical protein C8J56DRAFT_1048063 [Mycena floridula]
MVYKGTFSAGMEKNGIGLIRKAFAACRRNRARLRVHDWPVVKLWPANLSRRSQSLPPSTQPPIVSTGESTCVNVGGFAVGILFVKPLNDDIRRTFSKGAEWRATSFRQITRIPRHRQASHFFKHLACRSCPLLNLDIDIDLLCPASYLPLDTRHNIPRTESSTWTDSIVQFIDHETLGAGILFLTAFIRTLHHRSLTTYKTTEPSSCSLNVTRFSKASILKLFQLQEGNRRSNIINILT